MKEEWAIGIGIVALVVAVLTVIALGDDGAEHCYATGQSVGFASNGSIVFGVVSVEVPCQDGGAR